MKRVFSNQTDAEPESFPIFALSGVVAILGFGFGSLSMPTWHVGVESAQALAGIVAYPIDNAFYQYHLGLWTSVHQVLALLLKAGFSEYVLCFVLSGLIGALGFLVFSLTTYAVSRNAAVAIVSPLLIFVLYMSSNANGTIYPVYLMGNYNTIGILGRGVSILALIFVALARYRAGFLMLGLSFSIHPAWGMWSSLVGLLALLWERFVTPATLRKYGPWLVAGIAISAVSFMIQQYLGRDLPQIPHMEQTGYRKAMLEHWDFHRKPVPFTNAGLLIAVTSIALAGTWLRFFSQDLSNQARIMLRFVLVGGLMGLAGCVTTWFPGSLPSQVELLMLGRFANLTAMLLAPTLVGLAALHIERNLFQLLILAHLLYIPWNWFFVKYLSSDRFGWVLNHWKEWVAFGVVLVILRAVKDRPWKTVQAKRKHIQINGACLATAALIVVVLAASNIEPRYSPDFPTASLKRPVDAAMLAARDGEGLLISVGNMEMIQLKTRRPLVINTGGLDGITYVASSGRAAKRALAGIYGIDFFHPPEDIQQARPGALLLYSARDLFESRSRAEWGAVGAEFSATQVLVYKHWTLDLPLVAEGEKYRLYAII